MATGRFVSYLRVSTSKQGASGLGMTAQRDAVARYFNGGDWSLLGDFIEVESGKANDRPQLAQALALCRMTGATLIVAKLDRLARNTRFLLTIYENSGEGGVVFCDLPKIPPGPLGKFMVSQMAAVAELEGGLISERTKAALAVVKIRRQEAGEPPLGGVRKNHKPVDGSLGVKARQVQAAALAAGVRPMVTEMRDRGLSLRAVAAELTARSIRTQRGGVWSATHVQRVLGLR